MEDQALEEEILRLKKEVACEEERTAKCQQEITRLRGIVRNHMDNFEDIELLDAVFVVNDFGSSIGEVMEEAYDRALTLKTKRLSFSFNSYKITIKKED
jgi:hypothetical protein